MDFVIVYGLDHVLIGLPMNGFVKVQGSNHVLIGPIIRV